MEMLKWTTSATWMRTLGVSLLAVALLAFVLPGCPGGDDDDSSAGDDDDATAADDDDAATPPASFTSDVMPLFAGCGCHMTGNPSAAFSLEANAAYANMVDVASTLHGSMDRVEPGDPENSFLLLKVREASPPAGDQMPPTGPYLGQAEIDTITQWINEGALDN